ncbi:hypothetical protein [Phascolarctobacterium faecium]|uniref:hypothetical protein n=1 Tax=Phascolarctobacterium faecium TaxID=33025 RepID=UPI003AB80FFC
MIEYVKVKHDEECYICHSSKNVKTLRVAADGSNAANTIAFCDKCAGTVSRVLNVPMTFERSLDGEAICPHCKTILGDDDDIGYFFDNTFYCEFCGQRLKRGIK